MNNKIWYKSQVRITTDNFKMALYILGECTKLKKKYYEVLVPILIPLIKT